MQGCVKYLPAVDVTSTLDKHADHLGLHLRNTKYIAPEVSRIHLYRICVPLNRSKLPRRIPLPSQSSHYGMQEQGEFDAASLGEWARAGKDKWLWSLTIRSPGAISQMMLFRQALCSASRKRLMVEGQCTLEVTESGCLIWRQACPSSLLA